MKVKRIFLPKTDDNVRIAKALKAQGLEVAAYNRLLSELMKQEFASYEYTIQKKNQRETLVTLKNVKCGDGYMFLPKTMQSCEQGYFEANTFAPWMEKHRKVQEGDELSPLLIDFVYPQS